METVIKTKRCAEDKCEARAYAQGYCQRHYDQRLRRGEIERVRTIHHGMTLAERMEIQTDRGHDGLGHGPMGCWLWTGTTDRHGYGRVGVEGRLDRAHRVALWIGTGVKPTLHVLHDCDNPRCVRPDHLREGTPAENARDMVERERQARGERVKNAKLTAADVVVIRRRYANGETQAAIARDYGVGQNTISRIVLGRQWTHVAPTAAEAGDQP